MSDRENAIANTENFLRGLRDNPATSSRDMERLVGARWATEQVLGWLRTGELFIPARPDTSPAPDGAKGET